MSNEIKQLNQLLTEALQTIRDANTTSTRLVDVDYICTDLGVFRWSFFNNLRKTMPFIFTLPGSNRLQARLCDYENWKEELVNKVQI